jgi:hypothetical protein
MYAACWIADNPERTHQLERGIHLQPVRLSETINGHRIGGIAVLVTPQFGAYRDSGTR